MQGGLDLFSLLKETLTPMLVTKGVTETMKQQVFIVHEIQKILIMWKQMLDASCRDFYIGIMSLAYWLPA